MKSQEIQSLLALGPEALSEQQRGNSKEGRKQDSCFTGENATPEGPHPIPLPLGAA